MFYSIHWTLTAFHGPPFCALLHLSFLSQHYIYIIHSSICIVLCCVGVEMSQTDVYTLGRVYLQLCTALHLTIPLLGVIPVHLYWLCLPVYQSLFTIACSGDVCLCFFAYVSWFWLLLRSMPASEFVVISRIALHQNFFSYQATKYSLAVLCLASKSGSRHLLLAPGQQKNSFGLLGRWQLQNSFGVDLGLCSWEHLNDRWSWRHATIWSRSWCDVRAPLLSGRCRWASVTNLAHLVWETSKVAVSVIW